MSLSKTLSLLSTGSTQEDPSRHDWDVKNQHKQTSCLIILQSELCPLLVMLNLDYFTGESVVVVRSS